MSKKTDAWMPLWIGDYLADTQHLTRDEHGAYLLLLMAYWRNAGPLIDDDKRLAAIVKATPKEWIGLRAAMLEFFDVADGMWHQKRMDAEITGSMDRAEKAASKARKAAEARWGQSSTNATSNAASNAPSISQALHKECPSPSSISSSLRSEDKRASRSRPIDRPEGVSESVWADFLTVRRAKKAPLTQTALDGIQREAAKAGMGLHDALALCCARGWQGFKADWVAGQKPGVVMPQSKAARQAADQAWVDELMERRPAGSLIDITDAQIVGESA